MIEFTPSTEDAGMFVWRQGLEQIEIGCGECNYFENQIIPCEEDCPCRQEDPEEEAECGEYTEAAILMGRGHPVTLKTCGADFKKENRLYRNTPPGLRRLLTEPWTIKRS